MVDFDERLDVVLEGNKRYSPFGRLARVSFFPVSFLRDFNGTCTIVCGDVELLVIFILRTVPSRVLIFMTRVGSSSLLCSAAVKICTGCILYISLLSLFLSWQPSRKGRETADDTNRSSRTLRLHRSPNDARRGQMSQHLLAGPVSRSVRTGLSASHAQ